MLVLGITACENNAVSRHCSAIALLDYMLCSFCGLKNTPEKIRIAQSKKPYIDGYPFSYSHSKRSVCCAINCKETVIPEYYDSPCGRYNFYVLSDKNAVELGADIEIISGKSYENCKKIAERYFTNSELSILANSKDEMEYSAMFCRLWTHKESYSKLTQKGLSQALSFDTAEQNTVEHFSMLIEILGEQYSVSLCAR